MPHIQVGDVAVSVQRALDLGGRELMHAKDADGGSHWAVLLDPNDAAFGVVPVVPSDAIPEGDRVASPDALASMGRIFWLDLTVANASAARDFYREGVGWTVEDVDDGGRWRALLRLQHARRGRTVLAGICHARGLNAGLPPTWMIYLPVGDLTESLRRVKDEGGEVLRMMKGPGWCSPAAPGGGRKDGLRCRTGSCRGEPCFDPRVGAADGRFRRALKPVPVPSLRPSPARVVARERRRDLREHRCERPRDSAATQSKGGRGRDVSHPLIVGPLGVSRAKRATPGRPSSCTATAAAAWTETGVREGRSVAATRESQDIAPHALARGLPRRRPRRGCPLRSRAMDGAPFGPSSPW